MAHVLTTDCEETIEVNSPMFADDPRIELAISFNNADGRSLSAFLNREETEELIQHLQETWYMFDNE